MRRFTRSRRFPSLLGLCTHRSIFEGPAFPCELISLNLSSFGQVSNPTTNRGILVAQIDTTENCATVKPE
jgi:hypothetical protein